MCGYVCQCLFLLLAGWGSFTEPVQARGFLCQQRSRYIYNQIIKAVIPKAHIGGVNAMMAAPAGDIIYSGGDDGWIRWWQAGAASAI